MRINECVGVDVECKKWGRAAQKRLILDASFRDPL